LSRPASATIPLLVESVASDASGFFTLSQFLLGPERNPKSFRFETIPFSFSLHRALDTLFQLRKPWGEAYSYGWRVPACCGAGKTLDRRPSLPPSRAWKMHLRCPGAARVTWCFYSPCLAATAHSTLTELFPRMPLQKSIARLRGNYVRRRAAVDSGFWTPKRHDTDFAGVDSCLFAQIHTDRAGGRAATI
jgi:hypothetical protein